MIYIHKKARCNFKLSGKPMNGNVYLLTIDHQSGTELFTYNICSVTL